MDIEKLTEAEYEKKSFPQPSKLPNPLKQVAKEAFKYMWFEVSACSF